MLEHTYTHQFLYIWYRRTDRIREQTEKERLIGVASLHFSSQHHTRSAGCQKYLTEGQTMYLLRRVFTG
jgi:hypothetical protein